MRRRTRSLLAVAAAAALLAVPMAASADEHGGDLLRGTIVGNIAPSEGGQPIAGIASAGASWVLTSSDVRVRADGELRLKVRGLVVRNTGVNPRPTLFAGLACGGVLGATTEGVPFSPTGDAVIRQNIAVPATCADPQVLALLAPGGPYIGASTPDDED